jgi:hypothetical protein
MAELHTEILKDIAAITSATFIDNKYERYLKDITMDDFGTAEKVTIM